MAKNSSFILVFFIGQLFLIGLSIHKQSSWVNCLYHHQQLEKEIACLKNTYQEKSLNLAAAKNKQAIKEYITKEGFIPLKIAQTKRISL